MIETYKMADIMTRLLKKGDPLAVSQFTHPGDGFLFTVLIRTDWEYVVWTFNAQTGGFSYGSYFCCVGGMTPHAGYDSPSHRCKQDAFKEFNERVAVHIS